jgi:tetratricopeptide (TPR) repeat protein/RNase P/RNase MRP subunit p29
MSDATINGPEGHTAAAQLEGVLPEELYRAGGQYLKARDYPAARACLEKYLEHRPDDPAALHLLARALYHQNKDFDKAEECLNRAASLDPGSLTSYLETLGILLIHQARYVRAREVFEYALSEDKQQNKRHTAALKFYLDLAKKKSVPNRPRLPKSHKPRSLFFTADYGHTRMKAYFFVLPSIIAHALILLLMMYLSNHQLPFKKDIAPFTFVEIQQFAGEAPPPEEARPVGEMPPEAAPEEQAPVKPPSQAEEGLKLPTVPAKVSPQAQPKMAGMQMENPPAPAAPEINEEKSGARGPVSAKSKASELAMKPGYIAMVNAMPGSNKLKIKDVRPEFSDGEVKLSKKSLTALSGGTQTMREKQYRAEKLRNKASIKAGGTIGPSLASGGGPELEKKRLAKLEEQDFKAAREKLAEGKKFNLTNPALKAPVQDDIKNFPARQLKIDVGGSNQNTKSGKIPGLRSLNDMRDNISAYEKMQENLGAPMPSGAREGAALSKTRASLGNAAVNDQPRLLSGNDRMPAPADSPTSRRFASVKALPGRRVLQMPGQRAVNSSDGTRTAGAARLDEKSSTAPAGYAPSGINPQGAGGGEYAVIAKGTSGKALGPSRSEGGLGGLLESASRKMAGALGFGQSAVPSGPSATDLKRGGVADLRSGARSGSGNSGGTGGGGRGAGAGGVHFESAPKPLALLSAKGPAGGEKQFAGGSLGGPVENRYASAARVEAALMSADRRSAVTRSTLIAKNMVGLQVRIASPYSGNTNRISQTVTGNVSDARVKKVTLTVNSDSRVISVEDGAFEASVCLSKGRNKITVMAFDMDGNIGKDSVEMDYSEPSEDTPINIISPRNGEVFDVSEKSVVTVKGTIGDQQIKRAKLIFNGNPLDIVVNNGFFEQKVALEQERNTMVVEATNSGGTSHSQVVNVSTVNVKPKDIMIILSWDKPNADLDLHVYSPSGKDTYSKNPNTQASKSAIPTAGQLEQDAKGNFGPEVFDQRYAERGVYTVKSNYYSSGGDGNAHAKVTIILYGDNPSRRIVRVFGPHLQMDMKNGADTWEVTKFQMPEGIFLEE